MQIVKSRFLFSCQREENSSFSFFLRTNKRTKCKTNDRRTFLPRNTRNKEKERERKKKREINEMRSVIISLACQVQQIVIGWFICQHGQPRRELAKIGSRNLNLLPRKSFRGHGCCDAPNLSLLSSRNLPFPFSGHAF